MPANFFFQRLKSLFCDVHLAADFGDRGASFGLSQSINHLFVGEVLFHASSCREEPFWKQKS
jgi:hypothetical protein